METKKINKLDNEKYSIFGMYDSLCMMCKHFDSDNFNCSAFPDGIPNKYLSGEEKHLQVDKEQENGFIFSLLT